MTRTDVRLTLFVVAMFVGAMIELARGGSPLAAAIVFGAALLILSCYALPWDRPSRCDWCDHRHRGHCRQQPRRTRS